MIVFRAATDIYWDGIRVLACTVDAEGKISSIAQPVQFTMQERTPSTPILEPTFQFDSETANSLMNALWEAGLRPSGYKSPAGEVRRLEAHLEDMRTLVFKGEKK